MLLLEIQGLGLQPIDGHVEGGVLALDLLDGGGVIFRQLHQVVEFGGEIGVRGAVAHGDWRDGCGNEEQGRREWNEPGRRHRIIDET